MALDVYTFREKFEGKEILRLRVHFGGDQWGYSEYSAWENLGQKKISDILDDIKLRRYQGTTATIIGRAWKDCFFYHSLRKVPRIGIRNNSFYKDESLILISKSVIKLKLNGDIEDDVYQIRKIAKRFKILRLDCNEKYSLESFQVLLRVLGSNICSQIEYVEDPFPYSSVNYQKLKFKKIRIDHAYNNYKVDLDDKKILKPNVRGVYSTQCSQAVFTSNFVAPLASWHDYCDLVSFGNLKNYHGIYFNCDHNIFSIKRSCLSIEPEMILAYYKKLKGLEWNYLER